MSSTETTAKTSAEVTAAMIGSPAVTASMNSPGMSFLGLIWATTSLSLILSIYGSMV